jgi:hypothetical protein
MPARRNFSPSGEALLEDSAVLDLRHIYPTPARKTTAAFASHLITEQPNHLLLDTIVVWFGDAV